MEKLKNILEKGAKTEPFKRIFDSKISMGNCKLPEEMIDFVTSSFGSRNAVETQEIISIKNKFLNTFSTFNKILPKPKNSDPDQEFESLKEKRFPPFDEKNIKTSTPSETFGRFENEFFVSASNLQKISPFHAVFISKDFNPIQVKNGYFKGLFKIFLDWYETNPKKEEKFPTIYRNVLWRAGSSIVHNHSQATLSDFIPDEAEKLMLAEKNHKNLFGVGYIESIKKVAETLGFGKYFGEVFIMANLTPKTEFETEFFAENFNDEFADTIEKVYNRLVNFGMLSINIVIFPNFSKEIPPFAKIFFRGNLEDTVSDFHSGVLAGIGSSSIDPVEMIEKILSHD